VSLSPSSDDGVISSSSALEISEMALATITTAHEEESVAVEEVAFGIEKIDTSSFAAVNLESLLSQVPSLIITSVETEDQVKFCC
jgi:hypothetical protein